MHKAAVYSRQSGGGFVSNGRAACGRSAMAREYARVQEFYMQLHDLQPPAPHYQYGLTQTAPYELTAGAGAGGGCNGALLAAHVPAQPPAPMPHPTQLLNGMRKRKTHHLSSESYEMPSRETSMVASSTSSIAVSDSTSRKRKSSSFGNSSTFDDDGTEVSRSTRTLPDKKQNHSEIEKRRRDKMNTYISELSSMIPMCGAMSRKLDKLTVLRMAVQHLRSVRGALSAGPLTARPRPSFLSESEMNSLVLHAAHDTFLMVLGCDRGRLLYVSTSVSRKLNYDQSELLGQSLFDILHPKDVAKVKEQLSAADLNPRERLIDAKTMLPVKADVVTGASRLCPGARRSFFCRIKCRPNGTVGTLIKEEACNGTKIRRKQNERKYCVVQCTGYLKSWASAEMEASGASPGDDAGEEAEPGSLSCLVAVGRVLSDLSPLHNQLVPTPTMQPARPLQYVSRHTTDGKFLFVDQRVTLALGFLPQELLGTSLYEYVSAPELSMVARTHKTALLQRDAMHTSPYYFRRKDGTMAKITTHFKPFRNPWSKEVECLVANNTEVVETFATLEPDPLSPYDIFKQSADSLVDAFDCDIAGALSEGDAEMQRLIDSQLESHKIGNAIAEDALRDSSSEFSPELPADLLHDELFDQQQPVHGDNVLGAQMAHNYMQIRNNVTLAAAGGANSPPPTGPVNGLRAHGTPPPASPPAASLGLDGNGEAAMAVIMSLLEADAGLGGPVNFSGLPWPLP